MSFHQFILLSIIWACLVMLGLGVKQGLNKNLIVVDSTASPTISTKHITDNQNNLNTSGQSVYHPTIYKEPTLLEKAHQFAYDEGITSTPTLDKFQPEEPLTRESAAKMFIQYAKLIDNEEYFRRVNSYAYCVFTDKDNFHKQFVRDAIEACYTNIMVWENGYFMPKLPLTHQQANNIINKIHWLPNGSGLSLPITRGELIVTMFNNYLLKKGF